MERVVFIVGPTGTGKTDISIRLARKINGEIVCCDSMQVYKSMPVLTAQPANRQKACVAHHLFGIIPPTQNFSVAAYRRLALAKIKEIHKKNRTPVFVGGTGLYVQALLDGLFSSPAKDITLRKKLEVQADKYGSRWLYSKLKKIDPASARIIHTNDLRRIIRALEVYKLTGRTISQLKLDSKGGIFRLYPTYIFCLFYKDRNLLYERINERVENMFEKGLVAEVKKLARLDLSLTANQALGIRHIKDFLDGKYDLETAKQLLRRDTRRYAKRQLSWFRRDKRIKWFALDSHRSVDKVVGNLAGNFCLTLLLLIL